MVVLYRTSALDPHSRDFTSDTSPSSISTTSNVSFVYNLVSILAYLIQVQHRIVPSVVSLKLPCDKKLQSVSLQ